MRKYINEFGKPFKDGYKARVFEWQDENKVNFRLVVIDTKEANGGNEFLPSVSEEIITFYSNRNIKNDIKSQWFKNPAVAEKHKEKKYFGGYTEQGISGNAYNDMRYKGTRPLHFFTQEDLNFFKEKLGLKKIERKDFEKFLLEKGAAIEKNKNSQYYGKHTWHHIDDATHSAQNNIFFFGEEAFFYSPEEAILKSKSNDIKRFFKETPKYFIKNKKKISEDLKNHFTQNENVYKAIWYGQKMRRGLADGLTQSEAEKLAKEYTEKELNRQKQIMEKEIKNAQKRLKSLETRRKNKEIENKAIEYREKAKQLQYKSYRIASNIDTADKATIKQMIDEIDNFLNESNIFFEKEGQKWKWFTPFINLEFNLKKLKGFFL